jgi:hypothetical protein
VVLVLPCALFEWSEQYTGDASSLTSRFPASGFPTCFTAKHMTGPLGAGVGGTERRVLDECLNVGDCSKTSTGRKALCRLGTLATSVRTLPVEEPSADQKPTSMSIGTETDLRAPLSST